VDELEAEQLGRVLDHYDLGRLESIERIKRGYVNQNWALRTSSGHYFFKKRHPSLSEPAIVAAQHSLIQRVRRAGFPAPVILPSSSGNTFLILDGNCYEVQSFIQGSFCDPANMAHLQQAALTLAYYHSCVTGFDPPPPLRQGQLYSANVAGTALSALYDAWDLGHAAEIAPLVDRLGGHSSDLASRLEQYDRLPQLVIHGDYYADNLLFDRDRVVGVVDYDKARWEARAVELAEALIYFASPSPARLKFLVYPGVLEWEPFSLFLHGYAERGVLNSAEIATIPDLISSIWLTVSLRLALKDHPVRPAEAEPFLEELITLMDWAQENRNRIIELGQDCQAL
jgi:homoserine kinase type II